ncbi:minor tail protein [Arthrobacter phage Kuleana]|uniref:Minor tail protein n=1 Tax=Arthrobacter phage Kuleana TaxID=2653270 RepID=A0A5Q2WDL1_9CAUD|nr:minor tail protein [Arthrobacter phage Kuleana]QGH74505.1 minor tail protein [Arthrobacter phage Kuleana]
MLPIDDNTLDALSGSRSGDRLEVYAWYDGRLMVPDPLPVSSWALEWDGSASKQVQGVLSVTVDDPTGELSPWLAGDPLGVGGAELFCRYQVGGAGVVNRGWYRITKNAPKEAWYSREVRESGYQNEPGSAVTPGHRLVLVSGGASVPVTAEDQTVRLLLDEFVTPEQPPSGSPTVVSEITRIVGDVVPLIFTDVANEAVPAAVTYEGPRIDAVMDLAARAGARLRMTGDGELEVYTPVTSPVWTVAGGPDGVLINIDRQQDVAVLANVGIVRGEYKAKDSTGQDVTKPLTGISQVREGPLRVGGPHGKVTRALESKILNTQAAVDKAASTLLTNYLGSLTLDLEVTCLPNPALQVGDWVTVTHPVVGQSALPLNGEVLKMKMGSDGSAVGAMVLTVRCSAAQVESVRAAVFGGGV